MALRDYWPFNRRSFATKGTNPPFTKDNPRSFGDGVIHRIQLQSNAFGRGDAMKEPQVGDYRNVHECVFVGPYSKNSDRFAMSLRL